MTDKNYKRFQAIFVSKLMAHLIIGSKNQDKDIQLTEDSLKKIYSEAIPDILDLTHKLTKVISTFSNLDLEKNGVKLTEAEIKKNIYISSVVGSLHDFLNKISKSLLPLQAESFSIEEKGEDVFSGEYDYTEDNCLNMELMALTPVITTFLTIEKIDIDKKMETIDKIKAILREFVDDNFGDYTKAVQASGILKIKENYEIYDGKPRSGKKSDDDMTDFLELLKQ